MAAVDKTVYVVDANTIEVCTDTAAKLKAGGANAEALADGSFVPVAELEEAGIEVSGSVETWTAFGNGGWQSALKTGMSGKISVKGKRLPGDAGNDAIAALQYKVGAEAYIGVKITHPAGDSITFLCVADVKKAGDTGKATDVAPLEADFTTHGKPVVTPAV